MGYRTLMQFRPPPLHERRGAFPGVQSSSADGLNSAISFS